MRRQVRELALVVTAALGLAACQREAAAPAAPTPAKPAATAKAAPTEAKSEAAGEAFDLKMSASSNELLIRIAARPGYKINAEYPHNFRPEKDSGVQFDQPKFDLAAGTKTPCEKKAEDACTLEAKVPFKAPAGEHKAAGIAAFSVCNDEVCLIEKIPLQTTVSVN